MKNVYPYGVATILLVVVFTRRPDTAIITSGTARTAISLSNLGRSIDDIGFSFLLGPMMPVVDAVHCLKATEMSGSSSYGQSIMNNE
jgi:hypothetical protein